ncbi:MAG: hypothetical protein ACLPZ0_08320 [Steroidobacteraceae bacterium]
MYRADLPHAQECSPVAGAMKILPPPDFGRSASFSRMDAAYAQALGVSTAPTQEATQTS